MIRLHRGEGYKLNRGHLFPLCAKNREIINSKQNITIFVTFQITEAYGLPTEYAFERQYRNDIRFHENKPLQRDKTLYKFLWVQSGAFVIEVNHIPMKLAKDEIVTLTPLHHLTIERGGWWIPDLCFQQYFLLRTYGHDNEVSCNGFLYYGSSRVMRLKLSEEQSIEPA